MFYHANYYYLPKVIKSLLGLPLGWRRMNNLSETGLKSEDIIGLYDSVTLLKKGGQKMVYTGVHPSHGLVAIKIGMASSSNSLERINREVGVLRGINSKYYPKILDFYQYPDNRFYIIEEFIESKQLNEVFSNYKTPNQIIDLVYEISKGLDVIWKKKIVHRDVKPENILITSSGEVKIIDLGIARLLEKESLTNSFIGTPGPCTLTYAAPEQLWNLKKEINWRTDQFCLGIIMLQIMLKGNHPFDPKLVGGNNIYENIVKYNWEQSVIGKPPYNIFRHFVNKIMGFYPYQRFRTPEFLFEAFEKLKEGKNDI